MWTEEEKEKKRYLHALEGRRTGPVEKKKSEEDERKRRRREGEESCWTQPSSIFTFSKRCEADVVSQLAFLLGFFFLFFGLSSKASSSLSFFACLSLSLSFRQCSSSSSIALCAAVQTSSSRAPG